MIPLPGTANRGKTFRIARRSLSGLGLAGFESTLRVLLLAVLLATGTRGPSPSRRTNRRRATDERVAELAARLAVTEREVEQLRNTLDGVARERGVSVTVPCRCGRSLLLHRNGTLSCPRCGYRRSV